MVLYIVPFTLQKHFKKIVASIGLPDTRVHDLRHSFATLSIENGGDLKSISETLGHATVAFTLDVYGHVSERMRRENADRMERFIQSVNEKKPG